MFDVTQFISELHIWIPNLNERTVLFSNALDSEQPQ